MLSFARCPSNRQVGQDTFQDFRTLQHRRIGKLSTEREHVADIVYVNLVASSINFDVPNVDQCSRERSYGLRIFRQFTNELIQKVQRLRDL